MTETSGLATGGFPDVRYADADGVSIAYSVRGNGPFDLVMVPGNLAGILTCTVDPPPRSIWRSWRGSLG